VAAGWLTWRRFRRVTSSVLKLRRRCCRCTASFDDDASDNKIRTIISARRDTELRCLGHRKMRRSLTQLAVLRDLKTLQM
jgi:hypothetical protein